MYWDRSSLGLGTPGAAPSPLASSQHWDGINLCVCVCRCAFVRMCVCMEEVVWNIYDAWFAAQLKLSPSCLEPRGLEYLASSHGLLQSGFLSASHPVRRLLCQALLQLTVLGRAGQREDQNSNQFCYLSTGDRRSILISDCQLICNRVLKHGGSCT